MMKAEKMRLRVHAVPAQDQSSDLSSHEGSSQLPVTQDPENQSPLWFLQAHTHLCIQAHMHTQKVNF